MYLSIDELKSTLSKHAAWLRDEPDGVRYSCPIGADLRSADLSGADLSGANLSDANLRSADLSGANLSDANLRSADLSGANLSDANLRSADLSDADLSGADLSDADLSGANLRSANLRSADLRSANLSGAKNLLEASVWMKDHFDFTADGWIIYKAGGYTTTYDPPASWKFEPGCVLEEVANPDRGTLCGSGVNFGTLDFIHHNYQNVTVWRCLIRWVDACGIIVPFGTDGKARANKIELIEVVK